MPRRKLTLGPGARVDWATTGNKPKDKPFVVYLGDGLYLGPALGRHQRDRGMVDARRFRYAVQFGTLDAAEDGVRLATFYGFTSARVVPHSQVWRLED